MANILNRVKGFFNYSSVPPQKLSKNEDSPSFKKLRNLLHKFGSFMGQFWDIATSSPRNITAHKKSDPIVKFYLIFYSAGTEIGNKAQKVLVRLRLADPLPKPLPRKRLTTSDTNLTVQ